MSNHNPSTIHSASDQRVAMTNKLIRNTFILLGANLVFSALTAYYAYITQARSFSIAVFLVVIFAVPYLVQKMLSPLGACFGPLY